MLRRKPSKLKKLKTTPTQTEKKGVGVLYT